MSANALKISFVLPVLNPSGGIRVAASYATGLLERGHDVKVVAATMPDPSLRERVRSLLHEGRWPAKTAGGEHPFAGGPLQVELLPPEGSVLDCQGLRERDVVVATWWETAEWVAALPDDCGAKVYFVQGHEIYPPLPLVRPKATYRLRMHKIVVSQWLAGLMRDEYGDPQADVVENCIDPRRFAALPRERQGRFTVGFTYSDLPLKGCNLIRRAVEQARERLPDLSVVSFGQGIPSPGCPLPAGTRYVRRPPQKDIGSLYASADAWLWASSMEGYGLPMLEAMACGTPVIATPAGAAPQLVAGGRGVLVPFGDPRAMADAIVELASRPPAAWREMSASCRAHASARDHSSATAEFEQALLRAMARARAGEICGKPR